MQAEPVQPFQPQEHRGRALLAWRLIPTFYATVLAGGAAWLSASHVVVMEIALPVVILVWAWVTYRVWRACVALTSTSSTADTVVVQGWLTDRRTPVDQIMEVRATRYGPEIRTIDGREIGFLALSPAWSWARQNEVVETLSRAARAAHAAHPDEIAAAVQANAPLRARRERRRLLAWSVIGLGMLVLGLATPRGWHVTPVAGTGGLLLLVSLSVLYLEMRTAKGQRAGRPPFTPLTQPRGHRDPLLSLS